MSELPEYSFVSLANVPGDEPEALAYLLGLVDRSDHKICDPIIAKRILAYLFDIEEQATNASSLEASQFQFFSRYFGGGYSPQTPCMLTKAWSPIGTMLERELEPVVLQRERKILSVATGIWDIGIVDKLNKIRSGNPVEELFWRVLRAVSLRAVERKMLVSLIAGPGWAYETKVGSLPKWSPAEVEKADRIIWQRTPEG